MIKKLLFLLATTGLIFNVTGCTSKKAQDDSEIIENADVDKIDSEAQSLDSPTTDTTAQTPATDDGSLQAALGETTPPPTDIAATDPGASGENISLDTPLDTETTATDSTAAAATESVTTSPDIAAAPTLDETSLNDIPAPSDIAATDTSTTEAPITGLESSPAPVEEKPKKSSLSYSDAPLVESNMASMSEPKPAGSVLKKASEVAPYQSGSGWVNTVYVARPGEKLKDISQKIFSADKTKELKKISGNSYLKARSVKAGDKIYYVSPNRPEDSTKTIMYYEDVGMVPETYVAKKGDRLKKVSKEILGYDLAWKEMWTANPVESKDKLAEGETLKYWRSASSISTPSAAPIMADNTAPADAGAPKMIDPSQMPQSPPPPDANQNMAANAPPPPDMNSLPPPPPAGAEMQPPPPDANHNMAANAPPPPDANIPPPPPPPPDLAPPPPPPPTEAAAAPVANKKFAPGAEEEATSTIEGLDHDTMMSLGAVGVLTAALAFVLIRRKKKKAAEQMMEHDVGT